ncbi:uncharacterized protein E5676_scaffold298G00150 [Cucumis melo var. makuwa]|uniref:Putative plant transposon protein domain-containing protein n=1 Tax=Cucumis melo var. makuwa TaxID=1194695 RepID=A0A5A7TZX3_CUCMM|nr:uncharacterized protein E6C27_scaffold230G001190 [Cucumis melo var. makuwa]TYK03207.1 uncharacterized protein E5676_scaffold298G00150 [Cucumis melo var. makuwa]
MVSSRNKQYWLTLPKMNPSKSSNQPLSKPLRIKMILPHNPLRWLKRLHEIIQSSSSKQSLFKHDATTVVLSMNASPSLSRVVPTNEYDSSYDDAVAVVFIIRCKFWASVATKSYMEESSKKSQVTKMSAAEAIYHQLFDTNQGMHDSESSSRARQFAIPQVNTDHTSPRKIVHSVIDHLSKEFRGPSEPVCSLPRHGQRVVTIKASHHKLPPNVPSVPIDGISFHSKECFFKWKYVIQHRLAGESMIFGQHRSFAVVIDLISKEGMTRTVMVQTWPTDGQFSTIKLTVKYAILHKIGIANLLPSKHMAIISIALAQLIYEISTATFVDVGELIFQQILSHVDTYSINIPLCFSWLITRDYMPLIFRLHFSHLDKVLLEESRSLSVSLKDIQKVVTTLTGRRTVVESVLIALWAHIVASQEPLDP